ncbi:MAG: T9SS type A sorting domain-containing protein, partial [Bacteroidota bacterium]
DTNVHSDISGGGGGPGGGGPGGGTTYGLKSFVETRGEFIDENIDCTVSIDHLNFGTLNVFPNPVQDLLNIQLDGYNLECVKVYSTSGQMVIEQDIFEGSGYQMDVSSLPSGVYSIAIQSSTGDISMIRVLKL